MRRVLVGLLLGGLVLSVPVRSAGVAGQAAASTARASETALDRYVAAPDPSFAWTVSKTLPAEGVTATLIDLTSQRWLTEQEVEQPLWKHWLVVVTPEKVTSDVGLLFISGGRNDRNPPATPSKWLVEAARDTGLLPRTDSPAIAPSLISVAIHPNPARSAARAIGSGTSRSR